MQITQGLPSVEALLALQPAVALSLVISLDGQLAGADGSSRSISGPEDLDWLRRLRAASDVVLVGAATAKAEDYRPIRIRPEFAEARQHAGLAEHPELLVVRSNDDVKALLQARGPRVQLEAGVRLHTALAHLITRVWLSHSPTMVGDGGASFGLDLEAFQLTSRHLGTDFVVSRFDRINPR